MKNKSVIFLALCLLPFFVTESWGYKELDDHQLHSVTAGSLDTGFESTEALTRIPFQYHGQRGDVDGEVFVLPMANYLNQGTLQLTDNAQSNLRSLINVNAVNSPVQILLNLNININSSIGNLNQLNNLLSEQGTWR